MDNDDWYREHLRRWDIYDKARARERDQRIEAALAKCDVEMDAAVMQQIAVLTGQLTTERKAAAYAKIFALEHDIPSATELVVEIVGTITSETALQVCGALRANPLTEFILVEFDCGGGCATASFDIYATLLAHSAETKIALVRGRCGSGALFPLAACNQRYATEDAELRPHRCIDAPEAYCRASDAHDAAAWVRLGVDEVQYIKAAEENKALDVHEAYRMGMLTDNRVPEGLLAYGPRAQPQFAPFNEDLPRNIVAAIVDGTTPVVMGLPICYRDATRRLLGMSRLTEGDR